MTKPHWVVDSVDVVHHRFCQMIFEDATTYHTKPETNAEMIEHLARPDVKDRHHKASVLAPCDQCVLGLDMDLRVMDDLRARLAEVEANCTASMAGMERAMERAYARAEAAEARLAAVLALLDVDSADELPTAMELRAAARGEVDRPEPKRSSHEHIPQWCALGGGYACQACLDREFPCLADGCGEGRTDD